MEAARLKIRSCAKAAVCPLLLSLACGCNHCQVKLFEFHLGNYLAWLIPRLPFHSPKVPGQLTAPCLLGCYSLTFLNTTRVFLWMP